jgi:hypothetical protein
MEVNRPEHGRSGRCLIICYLCFCRMRVGDMDVNGRSGWILRALIFLMNHFVSSTIYLIRT